VLLKHAKGSKNSLGNAANVRSRVRAHHGLHEGEAGMLLPASHLFQSLLERPSVWVGCAKRQGREAARQLANVCRAGDKVWSPGFCKAKMQDGI